MIDSLTVTDATIISYQVNLDGTLRYIGISTNSIFEKRLSLVFGSYNTIEEVKGKYEEFRILKAN